MKDWAMEMAMDNAWAEREADMRMLARGVQLADYEEEDPMGLDEYLLKEARRVARGAVDKAAERKVARGGWKSGQGSAEIGQGSTRPGGV